GEAKPTRRNIGHVPNTIDRKTHVPNLSGKVRNGAPVNVATGFSITILFTSLRPIINITIEQAYRCGANPCSGAEGILMDTKFGNIERLVSIAKNIEQRRDPKSTSAVI